MRSGQGADISYLELAAVPSAPYLARRQVKVALRAWQLWPETIETAELLVSELITNAIRVSLSSSAGSSGSDLDNVERVTLTLRRLSDRVVLEVFDEDTNPPVLSEAGDEDESGRGLMLVQALSKEWGYIFPPSGGKTVYCILGVCD